MALGGAGTAWTLTAGILRVRRNFVARKGCGGSNMLAMVCYCMTQIGVPMGSAQTGRQAGRGTAERELQLTARQRECLYWTEQGKSARDIGVILGISGRTVEEHLALACEVLGVRTRIQAVVAAREQGILGKARADYQVGGPARHRVAQANQGARKPRFGDLS